MVTTARPLSWGLLILLLIALIQPDPARGDHPPNPLAEPEQATARALTEGSYPWYDQATDGFRAITVPVPETPAPPPTTSGKSGGGSWTGPSLAAILKFLLFLAVAAVVVGLMVWFYRIYQPEDETATRSSRTVPAAESPQMGELPAGLRDEVGRSDPWSEAIRRRQQGDLAGAVVYLFAHQLLTLSRLGLVRLAPGRTARQLLRGSTHPELRGLAQPTLRLFELVYYGHQAPGVPDFDAAWSAAERFERRVAEGVS